MSYGLLTCQSVGILMPYKVWFEKASELLKPVNNGKQKNILIQ